MNCNTKNTIPWEDWADEHILFMRPIDSEACPSVFEGVLVRSGDFGTVRFLHDVVFVDDYLSTYEKDKAFLDGILNGFGYKNLDDFVWQNSPVPINPVYKENGDIDRVNTPAYIVDIRLLASLIFEDRGGDCISPELAAEMVETLTGNDVLEFTKSMAAM